MEKVLVYDVPTRLFHWLFAGLFVTAFGIAKILGDDSPWFSHHMLLGLILTALTVLRLIWGLIGSNHARFSSLPLDPLLLVEYARGVLSANGKKYWGHNPASAWSAVGMIGLAMGLGLTGCLMSQGYKSALEDLHELMANAFVLIAVSHVAGVLLHSLKHQDSIAWSMLHGQKQSQPGSFVQINKHKLPALIMAIALGLFAFQVYRNYDAGQSTTSLFGIKLQLGEGNHKNDLRHDEHENHHREEEGETE